MKKNSIQNHPWLPQTRFKAFSWHLLFSYILFCILIGFIYWVIYPLALFSKAGGIDGVKIIAGVDLVLGPSLTFFLYNIKKDVKEIMSDLSIILVIQVLCLLAGSYVVYNERPAVVVYIDDKFVTVKEKDYKNLTEATKKEFKQKDIQFNLFSPKYYYLDLPKDVAAAAVIADEFMGANELSVRTDLYIEMPTDRAAVLKVFNVKSDQACIPTKIQTLFDEGKVCYHVKKRRLELISD